MVSTCQLTASLGAEGKPRPSDRTAEVSSQRGRFHGRVAIITGSGGGIGRAEALLLAREGARVVVNDIGRDQDGRFRADTVAAEIVGVGGEGVASTEDVSSFEGCEALVQHAVETFGTLDIVVNNAGVRAMNRVDLLSEDDFYTVVASHLGATFAMTKYSMPIFMANRAGVILNTGSEAGLGMPFNSAYSAAKEGIAGFTRAIAREFGGLGIRCNVMRPRAETGRTPGFNASKEGWGPVRAKLGRFALGERGDIPSDSTPEEVAVLAVWLCSDAAAGINGYDFQVAGNEIGLWREPELVRTAYCTGGWTLAELDENARKTVAHGLENRFAAMTYEL